MAERPPSLSPELRALLHGYRDAHAMPEDAKARVQARLDPATPATSHRPAWVWAGVGAVAAGLVLWGVMSISGALQSSADPSPPSQASMRSADTEADTAALPPAVLAPRATSRKAPLQPESAPVEPPLPAQPETAPPKTEPTPKRAPARPEPQPLEPQPQPLDPAETPANRLGAENRLIAQTWEHVRAEHYAKAQASLAEHAKSFPTGVLAPERRALEVIVDCLAHPDAAAGKAEAYARAGRTTLLAKVRSACAEEKSPPQ